MYIEQLYTGCLSQGAYYVESEGEAAVIDPLRETAPYRQRASRRGARIRYVFETHFHADFVSGHLDLARQTGATVVYGPGARTGYPVYTARDGEEFRVGKLTLRALHTPGHTPESTCYLLLDETGRPHAIFTGDTLFIGDVGRPDLALKGNLTEHDLAGMLYDSLQTQIIPLPDDLIVYPAHGAGSACGKHLSKETSDTLGHQKETNYALRAASKTQFVAEVLDGLAKAPAYFAQNARLNQQGYEAVEVVMQRGEQALSPADFAAAVEATSALVLDVRPAAEFAAGFIPNAINIGLDGQFAPWVGALIPDLTQPLALVTPPGQETEAIARLARVGYDQCIGYLAGGVAAWEAAGREVDTLKTVSADAFAQLRAEAASLPVVDVRKPTEFAAEHLEGAVNFPLDTLSEFLAEIPRDRPVYLHCAGGYRSMIAASILNARGFGPLINITGGLAALKKTTLSRCKS